MVEWRSRPASKTASDGALLTSRRGEIFGVGGMGIAPPKHSIPSFAPYTQNFSSSYLSKGNEPFAVYAGHTGTRNVLSLDLPDDSPMAGIECVDDGLNMGLGISGVFFIIRSGTAERGHTNAHPRASTSQL